MTASPGRDTPRSPTPMARIYQFPTTREGGQHGDPRSPHRGTSPSASRWPVSHKANDWAWTLPVRGTRQHVLLALAKKARPKTEVATPSMPELVEMTGLAESTIRSHIQALAKDGYIDVTVSSGGRHKRSTYRLLVGVISAETPREMDRRGGEETPREETRWETETPQELAENPPTDGPVVLRTDGGTRGGTTPAAAASEPADVALFDAPTPPAKPSRQLAVAERKEVAAFNAGHAVAAWVEGYTATHDAKPTVRQTGQVGRESRQLIEAGNPPERVVAAAKVAGERGLPTVERQYRDMASRRPGAAVGQQRPSTTDARVAAGMALVAKYDQEAG